MGGPFWARKDEAPGRSRRASTAPTRTPLAAARREFAEELGSPRPEGELRDLGSRAAGGKVIAAFALAGDFDADADRQQHLRARVAAAVGPHAEFPEVDRAAWFDLDTARHKIVKSQRPFLDRI